MKNRNFNYQITALIFSVMTALSCSDRNLDNLAYATNYPTTPEVFIDGFSAGLEYKVWGNNTKAFELEHNQVYNGITSMKFTVQPYGDANGSWTQSIFQVAKGRDLSGYNALTFYAKSEVVDTLDAIGFGVSQLGNVDYNTYNCYISKLALTVSWTKYYILIPDPSKLTIERGMLYFKAVRTAAKKEGFVFYMDDVKFEKLGTIAHVTPGTIFSGKDVTFNDIENGNYCIKGLPVTKTQPDTVQLHHTYNLPNGLNQTEYFRSSYLTLTSSNPYVANVNNVGSYTVINKGSTLITAKLGDIAVKGSVLINSVGVPITPTTSAPTHGLTDASLISLFSNDYTNSTVDSWNPYYLGSTAVTTDIVINSTDNIKRYRYLNWVCILFQSVPIDAVTKGMTHFHIDVWTPETSTNKLQVKLHDYATGSEGVYTLSSSLTANQWTNVDIPLSSFTGLTGTTQLGMFILASNGSSMNMYVDNIYFHK